MTIGYYVHHHGFGHRARARAVASVWNRHIVGLSSAPRPVGWTGDWITLSPDAPAEHQARQDGGRFHWLPQHHAGLASRMTALATWTRDVRPALMVVDCSVEVAVFCKLLGIPVATVVLPGRRTDAAHELGFDVSDVLIACWPASAPLADLPAASAERVVHVGAIASARGSAATAEPRRMAVLIGRGGSESVRSLARQAAASLPGWHLELVGGDDHWREDASDALARASLVVTSAGQGSIADVAARGRPALVVPEPRPFDEQHYTARALSDGPWPAERVAAPVDDWESITERVSAMPGDGWSSWVDGGAAGRFVAACEQAIARAGVA